jgi:hypothetical protein
MITHDNLKKETGGPMVEAGLTVGLRHWIDLAKKAPAELYLFKNTYYAERINVVLTSSAEAIAELAGRLG